VPGWQPWLIAAAAGAALIAVGIACQIIQVRVSIRDRARLVDESGDPWDGRTLEWSTSSPPPEYNFAVLPEVTGLDAWWTAKAEARDRKSLADAPVYRAIVLPRNSPTGVVCALFASAMGFALIWHIWWLLGLGFLGAWATFVIFAWRDQAERHVSAAHVERLDRAARAGHATLLDLPETGA